MEQGIKGIACFLIILATGCGQTPVRQSTSHQTADAAPGDRIAELEERVESLEAELERTRELAVRTELRRIDAEARLADLSARHEELSTTHDEAMAEVVRAQAKLRGSVSQADAASNIAEAEIALDEVADTDNMQARQARALLRQAADAFSEENFGGALYLSNQAKRVLSNVVGGSMPLAPHEGEVTFGAPLPLVVTGNSNLRAGPGLEHPVMETLSAGTGVDGYSYKDAWVRVRLEDGSDGWVYQSLVAERDTAD